MIEMREDTLREADGPILKYGLRAPRKPELLLRIRMADRLAKGALERRYQSFMR